MKDDDRLVAGSEGQELQRLVEEAQSLVPDADSLSSAWEGVQASIALHPPTHPINPAVGTSAGAAKLGLLGVAAGVVAIAAWFAPSDGQAPDSHWERHEEPAPHVEPAAESPAELRAPSSESAATSTQSVAVPELVEATQRSAPPRRRRSRAHHRPSAAAQPALAPNVGASPEAETPTLPSSAAESEAEYLVRAQRLLTANPSGALELANRHPSLYPSGSFAQERDLIRIDALRATGRHTQALGLVERFLSRYPNSGHSVRLRAYQGSQNALIRDSD